MAGNYWERITQQRLARRRLLKAGGALSLGAGALALVGCGDDDDDNGNGGTSPTATSGASTPPPPPTAATGAGKRGGTYGSYFATVGNYNVVAFYHDGYNNSGVTVYDRLLVTTLDGDGYRLQAAASVEVVDPVTVVFKLKPGMVYHDLEPANGRGVKASDIVATQNYVKQLTNAENSGFQRLRMESIEAPDDETVVYHMVSPFAYLFASTQLANPTAQPIIPEEMLAVLDEHPAVGSGPYQLESHTFAAEYRYKRFDKWHGISSPDGAPYFDFQEIFSLTDPVAQETAFRGRRISEWEPPGSAVDRLLSELDEADFASITYLGLGLDGFNANMNAEKGGPRPWHDVRFREAVYRLTDRQQMIDLVADGKAVIPPGPMHASLPAYQLDTADTDKFFKLDVAAAKQLLEAMNYDTNQSWVINTSNSSPVNAQLGEVWQGQLAQAGIKVTVVPVPLAELLPQKMQPAQFDLFIGGQPGGDTPYRAIRNQHSDTTDQFNNVGLFDPEIDALIEKGEGATDREENIALVKEVQMKALEAYSMSYITWTDEMTEFYDAHVKNYDPDPMNGQTYKTEFYFDNV